MGLLGYGVDGKVILGVGMGLLGYGVDGKVILGVGMGLLGYGVDGKVTLGVGMMAPTENLQRYWWMFLEVGPAVPTPMAPLE